MALGGNTWRKAGEGRARTRRRRQRDSDTVVRVRAVSEPEPLRADSGLGQGGSPVADGRCERTRRTRVLYIQGLPDCLGIVHGQDPGMLFNE